MTIESNKQEGISVKVLLKAQAILIAALTAAGYGLAYVHELGFNEIFGIPQDFIVLDLTTILIAVGEVLVVGVGTFSLVALGYILSIKYGSLRNAIRNAGAIVMIILFAFGIILLIRYPSLWPDVIVIIFMFLFFVVVTLITTPRKGTKPQKSKPDVEKQSEHLKRFEALFFSRIGIIIVLAFTLLSLTFLAAYFSGKGDAMSQKEFLVTSTDPELVVLREYGDNLICAEFNRDMKLFTHPIIVLRAGADPELVLTLESVGPLERGIKSKSNTSLK